jgi:hypothetical protein
LETATVQGWVTRAQEYQLRSLLGEALWAECLTQYAGTPSAPYAALEPYLTAFVVSQVMSRYLADNGTNLDRFGVEKKTTPYSSVLDRTDANRAESIWDSDNDTDRARLRKYLDDNVSDFPEWTDSDSCGLAGHNQARVIITSSFNRRLPL